MTTATLTLTDFLLARIADDEKVARDAGNPERGWVVIEDHGGDYSKPLEYRIETKPYAHQFTQRREPYGERVAVLDGAGSLNLEGAWASRHIARHDPNRVLAECEAKRRIVGLHSLSQDDVYDADGVERPGKDCTECWDDFPCPTLRMLSSPYADHPDYRDEWRP